MFNKVKNKIKKVKDDFERYAIMVNSRSEGTHILYVFTKEYKRETKYSKLEQKMVSKIKLNGKSENIDNKINRLVNNGYKSNFYIDIQNYGDEFFQKNNNKVKKLKR